MPVKYIIFYWNDVLVYTRISEQGNNPLFKACRTCLIYNLLGQTNPVPWRKT